MHKKTTALIILDGFGVSKETHGNAQSSASMPFYHSLLEHYSHTTLHASGLPVGLPEHIMGNSEVGHLTLGAGRVLKQSLIRINDAVEDGSFARNKQFLASIHHAKQHGGSIHLLGMLSDGGVHSSMDHLFALIDLCGKQQVDTYIHGFLDGRDTAPSSANIYLEALHNKLSDKPLIHLSTLSGRYFAMDRDHRWDRVELAYYELVGDAEIPRFATYQQALQHAYNQGTTDEFVPPCVIENNTGKQYIQDNDAVIFFNFRTDRPKELTMAFLQDTFPHFDRIQRHNLYFVTMTEYDTSFYTAHVAFPQQPPKNTLPAWLSVCDKTQFHTAETEKYAHVTYFFNGGHEQAVPGETRVMVPSPKVETYDNTPAMSAALVRNEVVQALRSQQYDFLVVNFANPDMVGHTGDISATVKALEVIDGCLKDVVEQLIQGGGQAILTADHGNCEHMIQSDGTKNTAHTTNKVPCIMVSEKKTTLRSGGTLADVAPTLLEMMNLKTPVEMTGSSLMT